MDGCNDVEAYALQLRELGIAIYGNIPQDLKDWCVQQLCLYQIAYGTTYCCELDASPNVWSWMARRTSWRPLLEKNNKIDCYRCVVSATALRKM